MQLPDELQEAIDLELEKTGMRSISEAREELTTRYRQIASSKKREFMTTAAHRYAYIAARLPATYAAVYAVLKEIQLRMPDRTFRSVLDLGAGPGTAMWAAAKVFPELEKVTLVEKDLELISLGKKLGSYSSQPLIKQANWLSGDLEQIQELSEHDLIVLSYSIGELSENIVQTLIDLCWQQAKECLVIIEPGTPIGFERIRSIRGHLISKGSHLVAPCPHMLACPMVGHDWCHFSARVERTAMHRRLKEGSLGYEDEKYSYIAASKMECVLPESRVLRHPLKRSGHVCLTLCTANGIKQETVSKRSTENYKLARKLDWGSIFP